MTTAITLLATLVASFLAEAAYRKRTGRHLRHAAPPEAVATGVPAGDATTAAAVTVPAARVAADDAEPAS